MSVSSRSSADTAYLTGADTAAGTRLWLPVLALAVLALALRTAQIDKIASFDELYHLLAARSWLAEGTFGIAEGVYDRTPLFTKLVAWSLALFGDSLAAARLPSLAAGVLLVVLVFLWTRREAGTLAAWLAALLLALSPRAIEMSQFARFYALHGLAFWAGAVATYALVMRPATAPLQALRAVVALLAFALALSFQETTLIGLAGLALWLALAVGLPWLRGLPLATVWKWALVAAAGLLALAGGLALLQSELGAELLHMYRWSPLWSAAHQDAFWFYHAEFLVHYPTLWTLIPLAVLIALARRPRPALFALALFATAFLLHSFAGRKDPRYLYYMLPFLFVLWAVAVAELWPWLRRWLPVVAERALALLGSVRPPRGARLGLLAAALGFVLVANGATMHTAALVLGVTIPPMQRPADWGAVRPQLAPWLEHATIVLTTSELDALYYLGRYDVLISRSRLSELGGGPDFSRDPRTGRPVIGSPEAVASILTCYPDGLLVSSEARWRRHHHLDDSIANVVIAEAAQIPLPPRTQMRAYRWEREEASGSEACTTLSERAGVPLAGADG